MKKYEQIVKTLQAKIQNRIIFPGDKLPTEKELMNQYQVSKITVVKALSELEKMNLVYRKQGSGTYVNKSMTNQKVLFSESNLLKESDLQSTRLLMIKESQDELKNKLLRKQPYETIYLVQRTKHVNERPFTLQQNYIPERYFKEFDVMTAKTGLSISRNFYQHFKINTFNSEFEETIQIVDDVPLELLAKLNLAIGTPVIKFYRKSFTAGELYEIVETYLDYRYYQLNLKSF